MLEELLKEIKELNLKVDTFIKKEEKINDIFDKSEIDSTLLNVPIDKNKKFNLVIEKIKPEEKKIDDKSSDTNSYSMDEDGIDFFPVRYRTINVNLNEDHIIITRPTKIIRINF